MYTVVYKFKDLQDNMHQYQVGDVYPRKFLVVKESRIKELLSRNNKLHRPLIVEIVEEVKEEKHEEVVETVDAVVEVEKPKRKNRKKK